MQKKKGFVSWVIKPKDKNHLRTHAFIWGDDVEEGLEASIFETKKACRWKTLLSVSLV